MAEAADRLGLTGALSSGLAGMRQRRGGHDPGRVVRDLAVMLADGGDCLSDLRGGPRPAAAVWASGLGPTAFRVIDEFARDPALLAAVREGRALARARASAAGGAPERIIIDIDATLITSHSDKQGAAGTFNGGFGFHPLLAYLDESREGLAAVLRPGNAGANTASDHLRVLDLALEQSGRWTRADRSWCAPIARARPTSSPTSCAPPGSTS